MVFGAVPRDQHIAAKDPHGVQAAALLQLGHDVGEHRVEHRRVDRVEHGADLAVAGNLSHAEQCLAVRPAVAGLQMPLVGQEGWALHEERGEGGKCEIGHGVDRVLATPPIGQGLAAAAQCGDQAVLDWHQEVKPEIASRVSRGNRRCQRSRAGQSAP
jgi:hypothetical protein